jgi:hypothetical protein
MAESDRGNASEYLDDSLIEQIWQDLGGQVPRERIRQIAAEAAAEFRTATVTAFVPVFVRRRTLKRLASADHGESSLAAGGGAADPRRNTP